MRETAGQGGREVPEGQQVRPDVEGLIGHLKKAEEAGSGGTLWMSVAKEDALLMEHLQGEEKETLRLHKRVAGRSQGNISGSIRVSPRLCTCPVEPGTPDPESLICHAASCFLPMTSKILCPPRSLQSTGFKAPTSSGSPAYLSIPRGTYFCHECCLRIWFCTLCLGPTARSSDG